jgi:hypothetical protein
VDACLHEYPGEAVKAVKEELWHHLEHPHTIEQFVHRQQVKEDAVIQYDLMFKMIFQGW